MPKHYDRSIKHEEKFSATGVPQERLLYKDRSEGDARCMPNNLTEAKLRIVAREMLLNTSKKDISALLKISGAYTNKLMSTVKKNGMLDELQAECDDVVIKMERENTEAARGAIALMQKRIKEIDGKEVMDAEDRADAFEIFKLTTPLTGVKEKHQKKLEGEKGNGKVSINIFDIIGQDAMKKAREAKDMTTVNM